MGFHKWGTPNGWFLDYIRWFGGTPCFMYYWHFWHFAHELCWFSLDDHAFMERSTRPCSSQMTGVPCSSTWLEYAWVMRRCRRQSASLPDGVCRRIWAKEHGLFLMWDFLTSLDYCSLPNCGLLGKPSVVTLQYSNMVCCKIQPSDPFSSNMSPEYRPSDVRDCDFFCFRMENLGKHPKKH